MNIKSKFYKIYFSVIAALILLLAAFLIFLGGWLGNYEKAQPETMVNSIIETYVKSGDFYGIKNIAPISVSPYESKETINKVLSEATKSGEITASSSASRVEGAEIAYTVKAGDKKIINVYFKKTADSSALLAKYEIISVAFDDSFYKTATITMPQNTEIKVNGIALDSADIKTATLPEIPKKYKPENLKGSSYATLSNLLSDDLTVEASENGVALAVTKSGTQYSVNESIDATFKDTLTTFAIDASKTYSAYMQEDSSLGAVQKYFATDTDFYQNIRTSLVIFALDHESFRFDDVKAHSVNKFSDNLYSCHVTLTQVLIRNGKEYKDYYNKNVFIYVNGNKMSVIDLQSTGDKQ